MPDETVLESLADFICGDIAEKYPVYRSSMYLTKFFESVGVNAVHDKSTRKWWVLGILRQLRPEDVEKIILKLVDFRTYKANRNEHALAVRSMNDILLMENLAIAFMGVSPCIVQGKGISFENEDFESKSHEETSEAEFLQRQFPESVNLDELHVDPIITRVLQSRVEEIKACPKELAPLALIFLMGSTLEGIILAVGLNSPTAFTNCPSAPVDNKGKVRALHDWRLADLIDVGHAIGLLDLDVKNYSHALRRFRNYIHPYEQMSQQFNPDHHTAEISWQVFRAAFHQLKKNQGLLRSTSP